jgi:Ca2+-binding EF-hand superfamily protein
MMGPMLSEGKVTEAEWKQMMKQIDVNGDGNISYEEFKTLVSSTLMTINNNS